MSEFPCSECGFVVEESAAMLREAGLAMALLVTKEE